jgi:outer membrane protein TolC
VSIGARRQVELGNEATAKARYDQTVQTLRADEARAKADLDAARLIAENTPIELQAARQAEAQVRARYDASLGTLSEVADVERLLAQAEIDDQLARLGVWRALLAEASAHGDLTLFLSQVK